MIQSAANSDQGESVNSVLHYGSKDQFGVTFELNPGDHGGKWLFGKFCYWINGEQVGDYNLGTALCDVMVVLEVIVGMNDRRISDVLFRAPTELAFLSIHTQIYGPEDSIEKGLCVLENPEAFEISPWVDIFDDWNVYVVSSGELSRVLYMNRSSSVLKECYLPKSTVDRVLSETHDELTRLWTIT